MNGVAAEACSSEHGNEIPSGCSPFVEHEGGVVHPLEVLNQRVVGAESGGARFSLSPNSRNLAVNVFPPFVDDSPKGIEPDEDRCV